MFVIDKNVVTQSAWREYKPDLTRPGIETLIRPMTKDKYRQMEAQARTLAETRRIPVAEAMDICIWHHVFEDWPKMVFVNANGENLPCIPENIEAVCHALPNYAAWAVIVSNELGFQQAADQGARLKNLKALQDGSETAPPE